jgi:hypothetical protein
MQYRERQSIVKASDRGIVRRIADDVRGHQARMGNGSFCKGPALKDRPKYYIQLLKAA